MNRKHEFIEWKEDYKESKQKSPDSVNQSHKKNSQKTLSNKILVINDSANNRKVKQTVTLIAGILLLVCGGVMIFTSLFKPISKLVVRETNPSEQEKDSEAKLEPVKQLPNDSSENQNETKSLIEQAKKIQEAQRQHNEDLKELIKY